MTNGPLPLATVDEAHASLLVISSEVSVELNEARVALEAFAEPPHERGALQRFAAHVHLARGALRLAEVYGGALLAEEMEHVARYVDAHSSEGRADVDGLDALMRAMEQLPAYVERVASGARDLPIVLLPLLNDLRAVRGGALLSEGTLLLLNLRSDEPARPSSPFSGDREVADLARRLRPRFQVALLGWIRGEHVGENLTHLAEIAGQFEKAASTQPLFQLWWVVGAVVEALASGGIDANVSVKRVLGHVDRELKRLQDLGEQKYAESPPVEVLNNLLYYVAQSTDCGPRVAEVRGSFGLQDVVAAQDMAAPDVIDTMSAPSVRLMRTVAAAIREDLTRVKDVLDIFVRKGATQVDDLVPQLEMLRKISDTLGVLGLGALRARVEGELDSLNAIVERRIPPDDTVLLGIASALIAVEDSLDSQLVRLILPEAGPVDAQPGEPTDEEFRLVQEAVLRECIVNMARIKEAVTHSLSAPAEAQGLDQVPQLVRGITAGLLMLGKQRAVEVMEAVGRALATIVRPDANALVPARLERLADAIVAVEYYMETLQAGRADQWQMLDAAEARLGEIEPLVARVIPWREARQPVNEGTTAAEPVVRPVPEPVPEALAPAPAAQAPAPKPAPAFTTADPEFLQLFVEEARENVARIEHLFPQWEQNPLDAEALRDLRRAFHTLKGSGRMVGAQRVSEFSWSVESLLNRVISQTLGRSPDVVSIVRAAVAALPRLIDEIDGGGMTTIDIAAIMARADALSGREGPALPSAATPAAEPQPLEATAPPVDDARMDPVLREIFRKETAGHIVVVRQFLERCARGHAPHPVTEALYRASHTLSGIAKTAGARQGIKVAEPMEHCLRKLHDNGHGLGDEALALLHDTVRLLESVSEHVNEDSGFFPEQGRLTAGWLTLDRALDAELARLADAAERTLGDSWAQPEPSAGATPPTVAFEEYTEPSLPALTEDVVRVETDSDHTAPHEALVEPAAADDMLPAAAVDEPAPAVDIEVEAEAAPGAALQIAAEAAAQGEPEPEPEPLLQRRAKTSTRTSRQFSAKKRPNYSSRLRRRLRTGAETVRIAARSPNSSVCCTP